MNRSYRPFDGLRERLWDYRAVQVDKVGSRFGFPYFDQVWNLALHMLKYIDPKRN